MSETPREPDRYDKQAEQVAETWTAGHVALVDVVAAALRAAEADALERYDDALIDFMDKMRGNSTLSPSVKDACYLQFRAFRDHIRALASPAAAPAAETKVCVCRYLDGAEFMGKCPAHPAPPSEPVAPAPDLRRMVERAQVELNQRDARITQLEALISDLRDYAEDRRKYGNAKRVLGAQNGDAYLEQWALGTIHECDAVLERLLARASPGVAGEGKT